MSTPGQHECRVAIEALRAGVPNQAAIRILGSVETAIEGRFRQALESVWGDAPQRGLVFSGGFGSGKSHLLHVLREEALRRNFVVSWVTVSKETPLFQPGPVFAAAMRSAVVPRSPDEAVTRLLADVQRRAGAVQALELWASTEDAGLLPIFAAVTHLLARDLPPELVHGIESFLSGGKPPTAVVRRRLAEMGLRGMFDLVGMKAAQLQVQRPRFMARLIREAGYAGWCVLIDEMELIGRYGPMQRANAYVEMARWLGLADDYRIAGLHAACAITDDFTFGVIDGKQDEEKLPERLRLKGLDRQAALAVVAMETIRAARNLAAPRQEDLVRHAETLRRCYAEAYGWAAPAPTMAEREASTTMRHHVRGWITEWDMLRLQGARPGLDVSAMVSDYSESADLSAPSADEPGDE